MGYVETRRYQKDFEDIMLRCLPNATGDYYKYNAFGFDEISKEKAKWLLDYGTDINMPDRFGYTPLHHQAMRRNHEKQVELYLKLGADIELPSHLNGGINWDGDFKRMADALQTYLSLGMPLSEDKLVETGQLISVIKAKKGWEEELGKLCELSVLWVLQNPMPIPLDKPNYRR